MWLANWIHEWELIARDPEETEARAEWEAAKEVSLGQSHECDPRCVCTDGRAWDRDVTEPCA